MGLSRHQKIKGAIADIEGVIANLEAELAKHEWIPIDAEGLAKLKKSDLLEAKHANGSYSLRYYDIEIDGWRNQETGCASCDPITHYRRIVGPGGGG